MKAPSPHWLTLRWRLMVLGLAGVAVILVIGSIILSTVLGVTGRRALDDTALNSAHDVQVLVTRGTPPEPLPVSGAQLVQVLDGQGRVVAGSASADRLTAVLRPAELARARSGEHLTVPGYRTGMSGPLRVVALPVTRPGEAVEASTVVVAVQAGDVAHAEKVLRTTLLIVAPLLLLVLGLIAWWVIGRALRPVEQLRAGAESISGAGRDERLPVPDQADEIQALAITLNGMLDRLSQSRERQRGFVADAAHELRSPLASMQTQLEVERRVEGETPLTDGLLEDVQRLTRLVEDLLLLARSDADARPARQASSLEVLPVVQDVIRSYAGARLPVSVGSVAPGLTARIDGEELRRVLTNLVDNAVRHASSTVTVSAAADDGWTLLSVTDDGPGIPAAQRDRAFERFTRLDSARDRYAGGSGLGLAIVRELVVRAGGTVSLADAEATAPTDVEAASERAVGADSDERGAAGPGLRVDVRVPR